MHDPFQAYNAFGSHYGTQIPMGLPYGPQQQNPLLALAQLAQTGGLPQMGQSPFGQSVGQAFFHPQQLQLASLLAQNPVLASILSNPLVAASLQAQALNSYGGQQPGMQPHYPQQMGQQTGFPLPPQSWIGQGFGPLHALQPQMAQRPFQAQGFSPWGY